MNDTDNVLERIDAIENELRALGDELRELRANLEAPAPSPPIAPLATTTDSRSRQPEPAPRPAPPEVQREAAITSARAALAAGQPEKAVEILALAVESAREALDGPGLERLAEQLHGIARYHRVVRDRALELESRARAADTVIERGRTAERSETSASSTTSSPETPRAASELPLPDSTTARAFSAEEPPRRGPGELARDWELVGPRGFAIVGGAVTALGIILLFVLAANNGWITPSMRVLIGVGLSALAIGAGFWARARYGHVQASLGATGAGIAGLYASLAAASARYELVPDWLALPFAAAIAAVAVLIAVMWSSQIVAAIGLIGAALAPGLEAIDTDITWAAAAFSVIVLVATMILAVPRRWHALLISVAAVVTVEVAVLADASEGAAGRGTVAVVVALVLAVLAAGVWLQLSAKSPDLNPLASSFVIGALGIALLLAPVLSDDERTRGLALATAALVWAITWLASRVRQPALALVLGVSALTLATVASADLLTGSGLAVTWAAESVLLSILAWRLRDARLQVLALAYGALATVYVLAFQAPPDLLFDDPVPGKAAISVAALACSFLAAAFLAPPDPTARTESGILAWLSTVRSALVANRTVLRDWLVFVAAALGTYSAMIALVAVSFERGHLAATLVAAAAGAVATIVVARRGTDGLLAAALVWLVVVYLEAAVFDVLEFSVTGVDRSYGGWALIVASTGVLAGCFGLPVVYPKPVRPILAGVGGGLALVSWLGGLALVSPAGGEVLSSSWIGWRMLVPMAVFVALAASVFRIPRQRDLATIMWVLGLVTLVISEWLVLGGDTDAAFAWALTGGVVALASGPLREQRLWWGGAAAVSLAGAVALFFVIPLSHFLTASTSPARGLWIACGCLAGGVALRISGPSFRRWVDPIVAVGALYVVSLAVLEAAGRSFSGSVETDFGRGHVVVSAIWALIGLALLIAGLLRNERWLRLGGLALFGLSLAKIFLYDLTTLSSVARALSFIVVGGLVLAGGFFLQRLSARIAPRPPEDR